MTTKKPTSSAYRFDKRDVIFRTLDKHIVLRLSVSRDLYKNHVQHGYMFTCGLYVRMENGIRQLDTHPRLSISIWLQSNDRDLETVRLICHEKSIRLSFPTADVENIAPEEKQRLLDFLKHMRGIRLVYVSDLFGFSKKDDSDKEIVTDLPFPTNEETQGELN